MKKFLLFCLFPFFLTADTEAIKTTAEDSEQVLSMPQDVNFERVWRKRYVFDNEIDFPKGISFLSFAHYSAKVESFPAAMCIKDKSGADIVKINAPEDVEPPYTMHLSLCGNSKPTVFVTKNGKTKFSSQAVYPKGFNPTDKAHINSLTVEGEGGIANVVSSLSAGVGQADVRFVTRGRQNELYLEGTKAYFTFSARFYASILAVGSIDLANLSSGVALEGYILFDYGDGQLRNDLACHLFYDDVSCEWRAWTSNFSTAFDKTGKKGVSGRIEGGINAAWSRESPLHGISIMQAKSLGLKGMNEDPCGTWDDDAKKWRLFVSAFTPKGIRAQMLESEFWDRDFKPITETVPVDSTGTTIAFMNGKRYSIFGSSDRAYYVYSYPELTKLGALKLTPEPWNNKKGWPHGRGWPAFVELPDNMPYRYLLLTFDRTNFPTIPKPNWTYGELSIYTGVLQNPQ